MMKTDDEIKHAFKEQSDALDALLDKELEKSQGLSDYMKLSVASGFGWLVKVGYVLAVLLSLLMFYCGYHFFTATPDKEMFWGVCLVLSMQMQIATKLWIFMHANVHIKMMIKKIFGRQKK